MWVEPVATTKLLGYPHSPHQREFCTEGLLGRHALGMLGRALIYNAHFFAIKHLQHYSLYIFTLFVEPPVESVIANPLL